MFICKKLHLIIATVVLAYLAVWLLIYFDCRVTNIWNEECIWNLRHHWFPFPTCVCVY